MQALRREWPSFKSGKKLMLYQGALYHGYTPASELEEVMQFVVPPAH